MKIEELLDVESILTIWRDANENIRAELWRPSGFVLAKGSTVAQAIEKLLINVIKERGENENNH